MLALKSRLELNLAIFKVTISRAQLRILFKCAETVKFIFLPNFQNYPSDPHISRGLVSNSSVLY